MLLCQCVVTSSPRRLIQRDVISEVLGMYYLYLGLPDFCFQNMQLNISGEQLSLW